MLYYALNRSHLILWGSTFKSILFKPVLPKKAIRCINDAHCLAHSDPLFYKCNILKFEDMCKIETVMFMFYCIHHVQPCRLIGFFSFTADYHEHNTRQHLIIHAAMRSTFVADKINA